MVEGFFTSQKIKNQQRDNEGGNRINLSNEQFPTPNIITR